MSYGGGRGGFRGGSRGFRGGSRGGRGGGRGDYNRRDEGPPDYVNEVGTVSHPCEDMIVCKCTYERGRVPYFNAGIYLENKQLVGKVDEILGPITDFFFSVKLAPNMKASSFKTLQKMFIDPQKTLPLEVFTNPNKGGRGRGRGGARKRGGFGGRGGSRGGFGGSRGGGFSPRGGGFSPRGGRGGGGFSRGGRGGYSPRGGGRY